MICRSFATLRRAAVSTAVLVGLTFAGSLLAQKTPQAYEVPDSRFDLYGGYGYFHPLNSGINGFQYTDISNPNATASVTGWVNRYIGVQVEGSYFNGPGVFNEPTCTTANGGTATNCYTHDQKIYTAEAGPALRWPLGRFVPFIHALGGGARVNGPADQPLKWGWGVTGGGGVDYILPFFNNRIALRPIQADFQYSQVVYGPLVLPSGTQGGFGEIDALKLSGGVVLRFGEMGTKQPLMLGCTTEPSIVYPGDQVGVTGSVLYLNVKHQAIYTWSSNGGKVTANGKNATIDTTGTAPGDYVVIGKLVNGRRANEQASCTAPFTVKTYEPPTLTCSANPATVPAGTAVDIATNGTSPANRPLTYSFSTSAGTITPNGPTAKLNTDGLSPSTVTVTCNAVDDKGQTAQGTTQVMIETPVVPVIPQTQSLCSVSFERDRKRPVRVDNEAKACLDDIALTLTQQTDAKLEVVGDASPDEKPQAAAERALNIRQYLTQEKGIDTTRIDVRVGDTSGRNAHEILVPSGATYTDSGTQAFDASTIERHGEAYGTHHDTGRVIKRRRHMHHTALPPASDASEPTAPATPQ
jgi:hypothetical protein